MSFLDKGNNHHGNGFKMKDRLLDFSSNARNRLHDQGVRLADKGHIFNDETRKGIISHPITSLVASFLLGMGAVFLLKHRHQNKDED